MNTTKTVTQRAFEDAILWNKSSLETLGFYSVPSDSKMAKEIKEKIKKYENFLSVMSQGPGQ